MRIVFLWLLLAVLINFIFCKCHDEGKQEETEMQICLCSDGQLEQDVTRSCTNWCTDDTDENALIVDVLNKQKGNVLFKFKPSPISCGYTHYDVTLFISGAKAQIHSRHNKMQLQYNCAQQCSQMVQVDFNNVFSGTYYLKIKPHDINGSHQTCKSNMVNITTYAFKPPAARQPLFTKNYYRGVFEILIDFIRVFENGLPQTVNVKVTGNASSSSQEACDASGIETCCSLEYPFYRVKVLKPVPNLCECQWYNNTLKCSFSNVTVGNYCVHLDVVDLRCVPGTFWNSFYHPCNWHANFTLLDHPDQYSKPNESDLEVAMIFLIIVCGVTILIIMAVIVNKLSCQKKKIMYSAEEVSHDTELKPLTTQKVLLLYPRDCDLFFEVMMYFRLLLINIPELEVLDIWDANVYNDMAQQGVKYVYSWLSEGSKIILMATQCARRFEKAHLNSKDLHFAEPESFDGIFRTILSYIYGIEGMYKKVLVVRLDGDDFKENIFEYISPGIVYTIPQHCNDLLAAIFERNIALNYTDHEQESHHVQNLGIAIANYYNYYLRNPGYLDELLTTDNY